MLAENCINTGNFRKKTAKSTEKEEKQIKDDQITVDNNETNKYKPDKYPNHAITG